MRRFRLGQFVAALTALALLFMAVSTPTAETRFAVDKDAYVERAASTLRRFLTSRQFFVPSQYSNDAATKARELFEKLRSNDIEIIPPIEWSDDDPDLPSYLAVRDKCPDFDFEFSVVGRGILVRATENFAFYRLPQEIFSSENKQLFAFRAERFIVQRAEWGRRRVRSPGEEKVYWPGNLRFFFVDRCQVVYSAVINRPTQSSSLDTFNEIVRIEDHLYVVNIYPLMGAGRHYRLQMWQIPPDPHRTATIFSLGTLDPRTQGSPSSK